ncbi:lasso peptide biosynthesis B2 protein [Enterobacter sp. R1(2018)]|uniref:lasso peptide biosynthesis B2 protein n=1 Tax=Enterobacter sp. R1(2018) TaxID=2447891 RepID=UPI00217E1FC0|nr:lasso peptide biosynthesis B2 protein [Enterobacter sp. R1(2018)]
MDYMRNGIDNSLGNYLSQTGLISTDPGVRLSNSSSPPQGVGLLTWSSNANKNAPPARLLYIAEAIFRLSMVRKRLQTGGLHGCLNNCRHKLSRKYTSTYSPTRKKFIAETLSQSIKKAAPFLPGKVRCLEFSLTLFDMLVYRNIKPALFIGFQRYDFLSHAWIEIDNNVISDEESLRTKLTPIISVI